MQTNTPAQTLKELQTAISKVDAERAAAGLTNEEREALELSAVALRTAERVAVARIQKELLSDMEESTAQINALSKEIRARVTRLNRTPRFMQTLQDTLHEVIRLLIAVSRWL